MNGVEKPLTVDDDLPKLVDACELSDSDDEQGYEENDEEEDRQEYQSLFGQKVFSNIKDLFSFESQEFKFDLVDVIDRYNMTMMDYIKMVNFIRSEKPDVSIFKKNYSSPSEIPWNDDRYLKTVLESDPVLQFDIEEDLDILGLKKDNNNNHLIAYQKRIAELESREEELIEMVSKLRNLANNLLNPKQETNLNDKEYEEDDSCYVNSYSNYSIHLEMLQDRVRTESYMNAILNNPNVFKDKIVLDVGCGTGILSLFAAKAGAKRVIAVDMSDIIDKAIQIADENGMKDRITFLKGKVEEVKLPVDSVDIIISEWMGYFLLFESMLDSVLFARDKYLRPDSGLVLPNFFEMHLFAVSDVEIFEDKISFWSNVYGFKMNSMTEIVRHDAQVLTLESSSVKSEMFKFKEIDCSTVRCEDLNKFSSSFELTITDDCELTGIGTSFETYFNSSSLENKVHFSTSPHHKSTHWQQTLFQFDKTYSMKKDSTLKGVIKCKKNPNYSRGYLVELEIFDRVFKYKID